MDGFTGIVSHITPTGNVLEWLVKLKDASGVVRDTVVFSKPIDVFPDGLPNIQDLTECAVQERFLKKGGTHALLTTYINKLVEYSTENGGKIWFKGPGGEAAQQHWEQYLAKWKPGPERSHPPNVPRLTPGELQLIPVAPPPPVVVNTGEEKVADTAHIQADPIDHAARTAPQRRAEQQYLQEQEEVSDMPAVIPGSFVIVWTDVDDEETQESYEGSGMEGVPITVAKVAPYNTEIVDSTVATSMIPVEWYISSRPRIDGSRSTLYDRAWVPWKVKQSGSSVAKQWVSNVPRASLLIVGGELLTQGKLLKATVKKKLAADVTHNILFSMFSKFTY